jgi:hypothetical protein
MQRKAQAEFALILGIVVIAVVVALFAYSSVRPPTVSQAAMNEEQKAVASFASDLVKEATTSTISELYRNGGYLDGSTMPLGAATHKGFGTVAYWQMCENSQVPDIGESLKKGVKDYINEHLDATETMAGKQAVFDKAAIAVATNVYDNRIAVEVNLPTVYDGASLEQPYRAEVYTKLGRINDFARNFAMMEADLRMLDNHLIKSLSQSSEYSSCWIPFGMGNTNRRFTASWKDLRDCMEEHVRYSLSNTQVGREIPLTDDGKIPDFSYGGWNGGAREFFLIPAISVYDEAGIVTDGDTYEDLAVSFILGDDDGLDSTEFSGPEHLEIKPAVGAFSQFMYGFTAAQYTQTYSVRYPVIVRVWDDSTGESMKFATYVYMKDNGIGTGCTAPPAVLPPGQGTDSGDYGATCGTGATEHASVTIQYGDGEPVANALVSYAGCSLGTTDESGSASGSISQQIFSPLVVEADGNEYTECHPYAEMGDITMTIPKSRNTNIAFRTVPITKSGSTYTLSAPVASTGGEIVTVEMIGDANICDDRTVITTNLDDEGGMTASRLLANLPVASYDVGVTVQKDGKVLGFISASSFTPEGSVYIYAPSLEGFGESDDALDDVENIQSLFAKCGLSAVSSTLKSTGVCSWTAA